VDQLNSIYDPARYRLPLSLLNWTTMDLMLTAWAGLPTFVPTNNYISDIVANGNVERGSSLTITPKTVTPDGTTQTGPVIIPAVPIGTPITFFTMSERKGTHELSELILFIDEADFLPFDPNGLDIIVQPDWMLNRGWWRA
jgi:hypothetical protein